MRGIWPSLFALNPPSGKKERENMIYTISGNAIEILDYKNQLVKYKRISDGAIREIEIGGLKADGGLKEIMDKIELKSTNPA